MGIVWQSNKRAWMTTSIMQHWLEAFYRHVGSREVLLVMDNFSAHATGAQLSPPPPNVWIWWLPPNSTSLFQPLDQSIILNFKISYKKFWLSYMLGQWDQDLDPLDTMNLHLCLRWVVRCWHHKVLLMTIYHCFCKSTPIASLAARPATITPDAEISTLYEKAQQAGMIHDAMQLTNFLNPAEEQVIGEEQSADEIMDDVVQRYSKGGNGQQVEEEAEEEDEEPISVPNITIGQALEAVQLLATFSETHEGVKTEYLRTLERFESELLLREHQNQRHTSLLGYFQLH